MRCCFPLVTAVAFATCVLGCKKGPSTTGGGFVTITSDPGFGTSGLAAFFDEAFTLLPEAYAATTNSTSIGACVVYGAHASAVSVNAGTITAAVNDGPPLVFIDDPQDDDYLAPGSAAPLWSGIASLQITVAGGDVDPFSRVVSTPSGGVLTAPAPAIVAGLETITASRVDDLDLAWTEVAADTVDAFFDGIDPATNQEWSMGCIFHALSDAGTVPAAALQTIPWTDGTIYVHATRTLTFPNGNDTMTLQAISHVEGGQQLALQLD